MPPRQRKRPDWPITVYKFWARPLGELPEAVWQLAHTMQETWNALIAMREACQTDVTTDKLVGEAKKLRWARYNAEARRTVHDSGLNWECQEDVIERVQIAGREAGKKGGTLRPHQRLDRLMIPHRFTGGGVPLAQMLESPRSRRVRLYPGETPYRKGRFRISENVAFPFAVVLHRAIPPAAVVKKVLWCGEFDRNRQLSPRWTHETGQVRARDHGWQWSLQLVCEVPPVQHTRDDTSVAGLDLGWRVMAEGSYLRIGFLSDNQGRKMELRLPLHWSVGRTTRKRLLHEPVATSWFDLVKIDHQIGEAVEDCKGALTQLLPSLPEGFAQWRQAGLRRLVRDLDTLSIDNPQQREQIRAVLHAWELKDRQLWHTKTSVQGWMQRRRRWLYQNLAAWLTTTYRTIVWEGDLSLKRLAEGEKTGGLRHAAKFRRWAALSELRHWLQVTAPKKACLLVPAPAAGSTRVCFWCGAEVEPAGGELLLECRNGHRFDQDENASCHFLSFPHPSSPLAQAADLREYSVSEEAPPLTIPEYLRDSVVQCPTG